MEPLRLAAMVGMELFQLYLEFLQPMLVGAVEVFKMVELLVLVGQEVAVLEV
jgi:hypothetical protein